MGFIKKLLTKNLKEIPIFWVNYNSKTSNKRNCMAHIHPNLSEDKVVTESLNNLIDYIRDNYDIKKF